MDDVTCPFISESCCKGDCRFWSNGKNDCIIRVVAKITLERHEFIDEQIMLDHELKSFQTLENEIDLDSKKDNYIDEEYDSEIGSY